MLGARGGQVLFHVLQGHDPHVSAARDGNDRFSPQQAAAGFGLQKRLDRQGRAQVPRLPGQDYQVERRAALNLDRLNRARNSLHAFRHNLQKGFRIPGKGKLRDRAEGFQDHFRFATTCEGPGQRLDDLKCLTGLRVINNQNPFGHM